MTVLEMKPNERMDLNIAKFSSDFDRCTGQQKKISRQKNKNLQKTTNVKEEVFCLMHVFRDLSC